MIYINVKYNCIRFMVNLCKSSNYSIVAYGYFASYSPHIDVKYRQELYMADLGYTVSVGMFSVMSESIGIFPTYMTVFFTVLVFFYATVSFVER
jgi:hypothetical protein